MLLPRRKGDTASRLSWKHSRRNLFRLVRAEEPRRILLEHIGDPEQSRRARSAAPGDPLLHRPQRYTNEVCQHLLGHEVVRDKFGIAFAYFNMYYPTYARTRTIDEAAFRECFVARPNVAP
jgi:hypothetical protein